MKNKWHKSTLIRDTYISNPGGQVRAMVTKDRDGWHWTRFANGEVTHNGTTRTLAAAKTKVEGDVRSRDDDELFIGCGESYDNL